MSLGKVELDERFPPLKAPRDEDLSDLANDQHDAMLGHGPKIARSITEEMTKHGRTRKRVVADDETVSMFVCEDDQCECPEESEHAPTNPAQLNCPAGNNQHNDNDQSNPTFLLYNNHCCQNQTYFQKSKGKMFFRRFISEALRASTVIAKRIPHAGSATEVLAKRSLGLRGSAKCRGTDGALLATTVFTESLSNICMFNTELNIQRTPSLYGSSYFA